jgi:type III restriction enzyme
MARTPKQLDAFEVATNTAPCVPAIREAVAAWRKKDYPGVTDTTRSLLNHWFETDHRTRDRKKFAYHFHQREAVETLVYLFEVVKVRGQKALVEKFSSAQNLKLLQHDAFARYCVKMATGTGKTKVMSLAIAWQYFNAVNEPVATAKDYAKTFLLIAPNVIVFERLKTDFEAGRIFSSDPIIPNALRLSWDFQCYLRGDGERAGSDGALYLTNVQQLHQRSASDDGEPDPMTAVLGPKPPASKAGDDDFVGRIQSRGGPIVVLNDEAHHTHDEESAWNELIRRLHGDVPGGLAAQFDFTATPRHTKGQLFSWTVSDYPLKQAILDHVVKRPIKGVTKGITERPSDHASVRYQAYLTAGVERWREYREQLKPLDRKPVLFVMMHTTDDADDVGDWLRTKYPEDFAGDKLHIIHTDRAGDVSKKDLDSARDVARDVDRADSPVNCIVSVLMLREGWDVQNVTVIVGLRPYTAKANVLPEQTIGRGLRLMFRELHGYEERVDVIGNKKFIEFVEDLEREEELDLETFEVGKDKVRVVTIQPDEAKANVDIKLPELTPVLVRKKTLADEIAALDIPVVRPPLPRKEGSKEAREFRYEGYDLVTLKKEIEREYQIRSPQTAEEVIGYYARRIAQEVKLPSQFAALVPKVREFLERKAFGAVVDISTAEMVRAIGSNVVHFVTVKTFTAALRAVVVEEREPELVDAGRALSITPAFPWSRPTIASAKCVFNLCPCENKFEEAFARFLDGADDVVRFAKLPERFDFAIEYTDNATNLRYYEPDFVVVTEDETHWLIETKGQENVDVAHKDRAAVLWAENATRLTGQDWQYKKVPQKEYEQLQPTMFSDLEAIGTSPLYG